MEYILIICISLITLAVLKFVWGIRIKDIKLLKELGFDKKLNEITNKLPENREICNDILKILGNENVNVKENEGNQASLYIAISNSIIIANIKNTFTRVQTIAHECLHSVQNRRTLIFNFILSNLYIIYFISIIIEEKNINEKLDNKIACEEKLEYLYEQKKELEELNKIINLAKETLEESYDEIKKNITPKFTKELSNNIEMISDGKYKKANFNSDTGLTIEAENGEYIECNKLSIGTIDQLYLSLRLSAAKEITKETIPIILDESFAYFDNQRLENVIKYLDSNYNNQIIIFTCTNREKEILDKLNIEYNLVNL